MKKPTLILLLLSLAVTGCVYGPGRGYGDRGWGDQYQNRSHEDRWQRGESHWDRGQH